MEGDTAFRSPMISAKVDGTMNKVTKVETTKPPMTARPSGACSSLPCSSATAIGTMPTVMAQAVIRMGRNRS